MSSSHACRRNRGDDDLNRIRRLVPVERLRRELDEQFVVLREILRRDPFRQFLGGRPCGQLTNKTLPLRLNVTQRFMPLIDWHRVVQTGRAYEVVDEVLCAISTRSLQ